MLGLDVLGFDVLGLDMLGFDVLGLDMLGILTAESLTWLVQTGPARKPRWETRQFYRVGLISKSDIRRQPPGGCPFDRNSTKNRSSTTLIPRILTRSGAWVGRAWLWRWKRPLLGRPDKPARRSGFYFRNFQALNDIGARIGSTSCCL